MKYKNRWLEIDYKNQCFEIEHETYKFKTLESGKIRIIGDDTELWYYDCNDLNEFFNIEDINNHDWKQFTKEEIEKMKIPEFFFIV